MISFICLLFLYKRNIGEGEAKQTYFLALFDIMEQKSKKECEQKQMSTNKKSPKVLRNGVENLIPMNERTPEERKRIGQLGVEARKKKRDEKMALQQSMKALLTMDITTQKQKQVLMHMGFKSGELTNQNLLMVALFKKGLTGDVGAIKEIVNMMDKLDMFKQTGKVQNEVTINLITQGDVYEPNKQDDEEIWDAENGTDWLEEESEEEEWGNDVYDGK